MKISYQDNYVTHLQELNGKPDSRVVLQITYAILLENVRGKGREGGRESQREREGEREREREGEREGGEEETEDDV